MAKSLLSGNKKFRSEIFGPQGLVKLRDGQQPHTCWIGCSDSRVPAGAITGAGVGELFVHRNVANLVPPDDPGVGAVLEYAVDHLRVKHIVICGHYGCGGMKALWQGPPPDTMIADWLRHGDAALRIVRAVKNIAAMPQEKALRLLVEENLRVQRTHLLQYPFVRKAVKSNKVDVNLLIYDIATGQLKRMKES